MGLFDSIGSLLLGSDPRQGQVSDALGGAHGDQLNQSLALLRQQALGQRSFADEQLRQALGRQIGGAQSIGATFSRPGQAGTSARLAQQSIGKANSEIAGQSALAKLLEQQQASQLFLSGALGARGQNLQGALGLIAQPTQGERLLGGATGAGAAYLGAGG